MKPDESDITDAIGELIRKQKRKKSLQMQIKIVGWLIVVLLAISFYLIINN